MWIRRKRWSARCATAEFTFEDFLEQMEQVKKMGPLDQILDMLPGANKIKA